MAEFPALPLFTDKLLADTSHLSNEEFGLLMRMMLLTWRTPHCRLPKDQEWLSKRLISFCGGPLFNDFSKIQGTLNEYFTSDGNFWTHSELTRQYEYLKNQRVGRTKNRKTPPVSQKHAPKKTAPRKPLKEKETEAPPMTVLTPTLTPNKKEEVLRTPKKPKPEAPKPDDVAVAVWTDFLQHRKEKRAPVTPTALDGIRREAEKAGINLEPALREMMNRGWVGFKADWYENAKRTSGTGIQNPNRQGRGGSYDPQRAHDLALGDKTNQPQRPGPAHGHQTRHQGGRDLLDEPIPSTFPKPEH